MCGKTTNLIFIGLSLAVIATSTAKAFDLNDPDLVAYWSFDEGSGKVANDLSNNSYNGTLNGGTSWTDGIYGSALQFNGNDAYMDTGQTFLNGLAGFTLAGWVSASNIDVYSSLYGQNDLIEFGFIGGSQVGTWLLGNNWQLVAADYTFDYPSWHHLALAGDSTRIVIYIDGQEAASDEGGLTSGSAGFTFKIGAGVFNSSGDPFLGEIDDVKVFSRALNQEEIQSLMPVSLTMLEKWHRQGQWEEKRRQVPVSPRWLGEALKGVLREKTGRLLMQGELKPQELDELTKIITLVDRLCSQGVDLKAASLEVMDRFSEFLRGWVTDPEELKIITSRIQEFFRNLENDG